MIVRNKASYEPHFSWDGTCVSMDQICLVGCGLDPSQSSATYKKISIIIFCIFSEHLHVYNIHKKRWDSHCWNAKKKTLTEYGNINKWDLLNYIVWGLQFSTILVFTFCCSIYTVISCVHFFLSVNDNLNENLFHVFFLWSFKSCLTGCITGFVLVTWISI